ncbi:phytol kinase 1, chloroplastic [Amborella trichopoda]|nr:phytol kinase 1, chloroplastic [Amborella trichopoda]|eukprot:XP_006838740.2 phytol kinase 1, chloroplastic [Amborella trichopoda]
MSVNFLLEENLSTDHSNSSVRLTENLLISNNFHPYSFQFFLSLKTHPHTHTKSMACSCYYLGASPLLFTLSSLSKNSLSKRSFNHRPLFPINLQPPPLLSIHPCPRNGFFSPRPKMKLLVRAFDDMALGARVQDVGAMVLVMSGAYFLVLSFDVLTKKSIIEQKLSRKLVHILSGLLFLSSWPIFSSSVEARYFAAIVPLVNSLRLVVYGLSIVTNEGLVQSVTRDGRPEELLRGPLYYVLALIYCTLFYWRESPIGVISLAMMCAGDGVADVLGRRFGNHKLPFNKQKSWVGSICMFVFGFSVSLGMLFYFSNLGYIQLDWGSTIEKVLIIAMAATIVESLPITGLLDDNITVPLSSMLVASFFFRPLA